jgi:hypothetical protein
LKNRGNPPIDKKPTPSYLSLNPGRLRFPGVFAPNLTEKCLISGVPEATSGRGGVLEAPRINEELTDDRRRRPQAVWLRQ